MTEYTFDDLITIRRALAVHYEQLRKSRSKKIRPSAKAVELTEIKRTWEKVKADVENHQEDDVYLLMSKLKRKDD